MWNHTCPPNFSDHTYATKHGVKLDLRIWPADPPTSTSSTTTTAPSTSSSTATPEPTSTDASASPWILYVHGGAYCGGKHYLPNAWVIPSFRPRGYTVVSIAYRFAPYAGLSEMKEDGIDAYNWCRSHLPTIISGIDIESCTLIGESAGGTIVSLLAHYLPIQSVINIYGPTDFLDTHYSPKTPASKTDIQPLTDKWSEEDCRQAIKSRDLSKAITVCPYVFDIPIQRVRDQWSAPNFEYTEEQRFNWEVKRYMRTYKLLFKVILRTDEITDEEEELEIFRKSSPLHMLDTKKIYPPTWFLHGDSDLVVPIAQAERMRDKLVEMGIETGFSFEPGQGHEFDNKYTVSLFQLDVIWW
jgi:acetyl esterase/lipase